MSSPDKTCVVNSPTEHIIIKLQARFALYTDYKSSAINVNIFYKIHLLVSIDEVTVCFVRALRLSAKVFQSMGPISPRVFNDINQSFITAGHHKRCQN